MTKAQRRVGAVVLTYNSAEDLPDCLAGLRAQRGVDLRVIVVDNASKPDELAQMEAIFHEVLPEGRILALKAAADPDASAVFLFNEVNSGYSAGNNIGARFAADAGCEAVLIINPDVRVENSGYVASLAQSIFGHSKTAIACSALTNLSGEHENPMSEPGFIEEVLWPVIMILRGLFYRRRSSSPLPERPFRVSKVSGACFLIRTDFLGQIGYFDESVFLYCEESILSKQTQAAGWHMIMDPKIHAVHAHKNGTNSAPSRRFKLWADSRRRFHEAYTDYGAWQKGVLALSRGMILGLMRIKEALRRVRLDNGDKAG